MTTIGIIMIGEWSPEELVLYIHLRDYFNNVYVYGVKVIMER